MGRLAQLERRSRKALTAERGSDNIQRFGDEPLDERFRSGGVRNERPDARAAKKVIDNHRLFGRISFCPVTPLAVPGIKGS